MIRAFTHHGRSIGHVAYLIIQRTRDCVAAVQATDVGRPLILFAMNWTDFDADNQTTLALHLITGQGTRRSFG
jgi:hypothetical protein